MLVEQILNDQQYFDDLLVRSTYHSAAIEGNTITIDETRVLLIDGIVPNFRRNVSLRELYEIENLRVSFKYLFQNINKKIDISFMHELHKLTLNHIDFDGGHFKKTQNMVGGSLTTPPEKVSTEILYLIDQLYNGWLAYSKTPEDIVKSALLFHISYEKIHPYADGKGRTGRLLMNHILLANNVPLFVIRAEDRPLYFECIRTEDINKLLSYAMEQIDKERKLIDRNK